MGRAKLISYQKLSYIGDLELYQGVICNKNWSFDLNSLCVGKGERIYRTTIGTTFKLVEDKIIARVGTIDVTIPGTKMLNYVLHEDGVAFTSSDDVILGEEDTKYNHYWCDNITKKFTQFSNYTYYYNESSGITITKPDRKTFTVTTKAGTEVVVTKKPIGVSGGIFYYVDEEDEDSDCIYKLNLSSMTNNKLRRYNDNKVYVKVGHLIVESGSGVTIYDSLGNSTHHPIFKHTDYMGSSNSYPWSVTSSIMTIYDHNVSVVCTMPVKGLDIDKVFIYNDTVTIVYWDGLIVTWSFI